MNPKPYYDTIKSLVFYMLGKALPLVGEGKSLPC